MAKTRATGLTVGLTMATRLPAQVILAFLVLLATPISAHASSSDRVVIDIVQTSDTEAAMQLLKESFGEGFTADVLTIDQLVEVGDWPWAFGPSAKLEPCSTEPTTATDITAALSAAEELITGLDYDAALGNLDLLADALCACTEPLPPEVTHRIPFLQGLIHFYDGDEAQARSAFRQAGEMASNLEWDTSYSPEPQQLFLLGIGDGVQVPPSKLLLPADGRPDQVFVDGREVGSDATEMAVRGQRHVVQFGPKIGPLTGVLLLIDTPGDVPLFGSDSFHAGLLESPDNEPESHAFTILSKVAAEQGYTEVMVLNDPKWNHCWWAQTEDSEWKQTALTVGVTLQKARHHRTAGGVLTGTGGALIAGGAILAAAEFTQMGDMKPEMETYSSTYDFNIEEYDSRQRLAGLGIGLVADGAAAMTTGIILLSKGKAIQRETGVDPRLAFVATPEGAWLGIGGRF